MKNESLPEDEVKCNVNNLTDFLANLPIRVTFVYYSYVIKSKATLSLYVSVWLPKVKNDIWYPIKWHIFIVCFAVFHTFTPSFIQWIKLCQG